MLTLKQARRMVAKSRRRVWKMARRYHALLWQGALDAPSNRFDDGVTLYLAETFLPAIARHDAKKAQVCAEFVQRWVTYSRLVNATAPYRVGPDLREVLDYEEGEICAVCGAEMDWIECDTCGGEGGRDNDALMEEDPLWYDGIEWEDCSDCNGKGGWWECYRAPHNGVGQ